LIELIEASTAETLLLLIVSSVLIDTWNYRKPYNVCACR